MKKTFLIIISSFMFILKAHTQNINVCPYQFDLEPEQVKTVYMIYDDVLIGMYYGNSADSYLHYREENPNNFITKLKVNNDSGYLYFNYSDLMGNITYDRSSYIISGKGILLLSDRNGDIIKKTLTDNDKKIANNYLKLKAEGINNENQSHERWGRVITVDDNIKYIKASSYLIEGDTSYKPENMIGRIDFKTGDDYIAYRFNSFLPPWVEGVNGYGINEWLDIEFKSQSNEIQILNGYVDLRRMHLYKANSRVKKILVESDKPKFKKEYELEDVVKYNLITLPQETNKIRITIKEVYKGDKYDDTCISSIIVTDKNKIDFEKQKDRIVREIRDNGIYKKIEEFKKDN